MPEIKEDTYTGIAADKKYVYVMVSGRLIALDIKTGREIWNQDFRQDGISTHWAKLGKSDGKLFLVTRTHLVVLNEKRGNLLWIYDAGYPSEPWPLVHNGMACLAPRKGGRPMGSLRLGPPPSPPSAIRITRLGKNYILTPMSRRDIPRGAEVWWALRPPPVSVARPGQGIKLKMSWKLAECPEDDHRVELDLSSVLRDESSSVYLKFDVAIDRAELLKGQAVVAQDEW